jgi:hypothetical protein
MKTRTFRGAVMLLAAVAFLAAGCADGAGREWKTTDLTNDLIRVQIVPQIGGRVIQYKLGDYGFFWVNKALAGIQPPAGGLGPDGSWLNYGGDKLWPAPQGWDNDQQWPGPPDAVLDGGPYHAKWTRIGGRLVAVVLTSLPDRRSGIRFSRALRVSEDSTHVSIDATMTNIDTKPRRWGIWAHTQFNAESRHGRGWNRNLWGYCPINANSVFARGYGVLFGKDDNPSFQPDRKNGIMRVNYQYRVGKIGLDSPDGWLATVDQTDGYAFVHRFAFEPTKPYPDKSSVEFWLNGRGEIKAYGKVMKMPDSPPANPYVIESEVLSPFASLKPGESYTYHYDWYSAKVPPRMPVVACSDVGVVCEPLKAKAADGRLRLTGSFGVFYKGSVELSLLDANGKAAARARAIPIVPTKPLIVSRTALSGTPLPGAATTVVLTVKDAEGKIVGQLAQAKIER